MDTGSSAAAAPTSPQTGKRSRSGARMPAPVDKQVMPDTNGAVAAHASLDSAPATYADASRAPAPLAIQAAMLPDHTLEGATTPYSVGGVSHGEDGAGGVTKRASSTRKSNSRAAAMSEDGDAAGTAGGSGGGAGSALFASSVTWWRGHRIGVLAPRAGAWGDINTLHDRGLLGTSEMKEDDATNRAFLDKFWRRMVAPFMLPPDSRNINTLRYYLERGVGEDVCMSLGDVRDMPQVAVDAVSSMYSGTLTALPAVPVSHVPGNKTAAATRAAGEEQDGDAHVCAMVANGARAATVRMHLNDGPSAPNAHVRICEPDWAVAARLAAPSVSCASVSAWDACTAAPPPPSDLQNLEQTLFHELQDAREATSLRMGQLLARVQYGGEAGTLLHSFDLALEDDILQTLLGCTPLPVDAAGARTVRSPPPDVLDDGAEVIPHNFASCDAAVGGSMLYASLPYLPPAPPPSRPRRRDRNEVQEAVIALLGMEMSTWRMLTHTLHRGIRDQAPGFNMARQEEDVVPASWLIPVDGRPRPAPGTIAAADAPTDAVCAVCFDGHGQDFNPLVYCDGCDVAVHKCCYGIGAIPDENFFCDVCTSVNEARKRGRAALRGVRGISCALCPVTGGALKRTTDDRWVHVVCALWHTGVWITDLCRMGPVEIRPHAACRHAMQHVTSPDVVRAMLTDPVVAQDVTNVLARHARITGSATLQHTHDADMDVLLAMSLDSQCVHDGSTVTAMTAEERRTPVGDTHSVFRDESAASSASVRPLEGLHHEVPVSSCSICGEAWGRLILCCAAACTVTYHPLCAWYAGQYMRLLRPSREGDAKTLLQADVAASFGSAASTWSVDLCAPTYTEEDACMYRGGGAGLYFLNLCPAHAPTGRDAAQQAAIRQHYRVQERAEISLHARVEEAAVEPTSDDVAPSTPQVLLDDEPAPAVFTTARSRIRRSIQDQKKQSRTNVAPVRVKAETIAADADADANGNGMPTLPVILADAADEDAYAQNMCAVCLDAATTPALDLLQCSHCSMRAHAACLGLTSLVSEIGVRASDVDFTCDRCRAVEETVGILDDAARTRRAALNGMVLVTRSDGVRMLDIRCKLCLRRGGALRQSRVRDVWIHVFCGLTVPGVTWLVPEKLQQPSVAGIEKGRWTRTCSICNRAGGATLACPTCAIPFHAMCAAHTSCYFDWRRNETTQTVEAVLCCRLHPPMDVVYDPRARRWMRKDSPEAHALMPPEYHRAQQLLVNLTSARGILKEVLKRERTKRRLVEAQMTLFDAERRLHGDASAPAPTPLPASALAASAPASGASKGAVRKRPSGRPRKKSVAAVAEVVSAPVALAAAVATVGLPPSPPHVRVRVHMSQVSGMTWHALRCMQTPSSPAASRPVVAAAPPRAAASTPRATTKASARTVGPAPAAAATAPASRPATSTAGAPASPPSAPVVRAPGVFDSSRLNPAAMHVHCNVVLSALYSFLRYDGVLNSVSVPRNLLEAGYLTAAGYAYHALAAAMYPALFCHVQLVGEAGARYTVPVAYFHAPPFQPVASTPSEIAAAARLPQPTHACSAIADTDVGAALAEVRTGARTSKYSNLNAFIAELKRFLVFFVQTHARKGAAINPAMHTFAQYVNTLTAGGGAIAIQNLCRLASFAHGAALGRPSATASAAASASGRAAGAKRAREVEPPAGTGPLELHAEVAHCGQCVCAACKITYALAAFGSRVSYPIPRMESNEDSAHMKSHSWCHYAWVCPACWHNPRVTERVVGRRLWMFDHLTGRWDAVVFGGMEPVTRLHEIMVGEERIVMYCDLSSKYVRFDELPPRSYPSGMPFTLPAGAGASSAPPPRPPPAATDAAGAAKS